MNLGSVSALNEVTRPKRITNSRYRTDTVLSDGTRIFHKTWRRPDVEASVDDTYHTVGPGEENRLDLIAWKYYRDVTLWWAIALKSSIRHPHIVPAGTVLLVPALSTVFTDILET
jgi:hypothetical protein